MCLDSNNLKINITKTSIMHFSQRLLIPQRRNIECNNNYTSTVDSTKFLGLTIDEKLIWKDQIQTLKSRIIRIAYALFSLSKVIGIKALSAYYGLVESILRYGFIFWRNATNVKTVF